MEKDITDDADIYFIYDNKYIINSGIIEKHLENLKNYSSIEFDKEYNNPIHSLPDNIKNIVINIVINSNTKYIDKIQYPPNLEHLCLKLYYSKNIYNQIFIQNNIKFLNIPNTINKLKILIIPQNYDFLIEEMEEKIYTTIENYIPKNILEINTNFPIDYTKFTNLKSITISDEYFNQPLNNLPSGLEELYIDSIAFNHPLDNLPITLKILKFAQYRTVYYYDGYQYNLDYLPFSLEKLYLPQITGVSGEEYGVTIDNLPQNLKFLSLPLMYDYDISLNNLPDSIEIIEFIDIFSFTHRNKIYKLPNNLKEFRIGHYKNHKNDDTIKMLKEKYPLVRFVATE